MNHCVTAEFATSAWLALHNVLRNSLIELQSVLNPGGDCRCTLLLSSLFLTPILLSLFSRDFNATLLKLWKIFVVKNSQCRYLTVIIILFRDSLKKVS